MNKDSRLIFEAYALKGLAAGKTLEDIAKKHGVKIEDLTTELDKGIKTEHEHTGNEAAAKKIAMDHLFEDPKYYTKLAKAEDEENKDEEGDLMSHMKQKGMIPSDAKVTTPAHASQEDEMPAPEFYKLAGHIKKCPYAAKGCKCEGCSECAANKAQAEEEELKGGQNKLDANHDGKISGADFKLLRKRNLSHQ